MTRPFSVLLGLAWFTAAIVAVVMGHLILGILDFAVASWFFFAAWDDDANYGVRA